MKEMSPQTQHLHVVTSYWTAESQSGSTKNLPSTLSDDEIYTTASVVPTKTLQRQISKLKQLLEIRRTLRSNTWLTNMTITKTISAYGGPNFHHPSQCWLPNSSQVISVAIISYYCNLDDRRPRLHRSSSIKTCNGTCEAWRCKASGTNGCFIPWCVKMDDKHEQQLCILDQCPTWKISVREFIYPRMRPRMSRVYFLPSPCMNLDRLTGSWGSVGDPKLCMVHQLHQSGANDHHIHMEVETHSVIKTEKVVWEAKSWARNSGTVLIKFGETSFLK